MATGMYSMEWYKWISEKDVERFQRWLIQWSKECGKGAVFLFDKSSLGVNTAYKIEGVDSFHVIKLPRILVEYICITGEMCILRRVILTDSEPEKVIYKIPDSWNGTSPWYAD